MNCSEVQNVLSAYHDGELAGAEVAAVARHVVDCRACSAALAEFEELSYLAAELREPPAAPAMWDAIAAKLEVSTCASAVARPLERRRIQPIALALAASLLVATLTAIGVWQWKSGDERARLAVNFDAYLSQFAHDPQAAQQVLLVNYNGRRVELNEAEKTLGYMPAAGARIPDGYTLQDVYLLKMPCCECAQIVYRNARGKMVAVFEQNLAQPMCVGNCAATNCQCNGMSTDVIQIAPQRFAASWKQGERYITVVGMENMDEIKQIMAQLQLPASDRTNRVLESQSLEL